MLQVPHIRDLGERGSSAQVFLLPAPYWLLPIAPEICTSAYSVQRESGIYPSKARTEKILGRQAIQCSRLNQVMFTTPQLVDILRDTIRRVEQSADIGPDDPALLALKSVILLRIAALELEEVREPPTPATTIPSEAPLDPN